MTILSPRPLFTKKSFAYGSVYFFVKNTDKNGLRRLYALFECFIYKGYCLPNQPTLCEPALALKYRWCESV